MLSPIKIFHNSCAKMHTNLGVTVLCFQASAKKEIEESMQVFSELVRSIQRAQAELVLVFEEKQRQTERWAEGLLADLEQEIAELKKRNADLEYVALTDHIHFLKVIVYFENKVSRTFIKLFLQSK